MSNYENKGEEQYLYIFSDDTSVQYSLDGASWGYWIDLSKLDSSWITTDGSEITKHVVGYNSALSAFYVENYRVDNDDVRLSGSDVYYFVYARHGRDLMGCKSPVCKPVTVVMTGI